MKAIYSPFNDDDFNEYLCSYVKERLKRRSLFFERKFSESLSKLKKEDLNDIDDISYNPDDVINSIKRNNRTIYFSDKKLINHVVYDLCHRFWFDELNSINNKIYTIYFRYKGS